MTPRLEIGGRWDSGDGRGRRTRRRRNVPSYPPWCGYRNGRYLLVHQKAAFDEWGANLTFTLDPGLAQRGWLTFAPA